MERAILVIVAIVAIVGAVGIFTSYDFMAGEDVFGDGGMTGNVVAETGNAQDCSSCSGYAPVCAKVNQRYITFANACDARCSGAEVAADFPCENIPTN